LRHFAKCAGRLETRRARGYGDGPSSEAHFRRRSSVKSRAGAIRSPLSALARAAVDVVVADDSADDVRGLDLLDAMHH
jgi:hypothetical protein